MLNLETIASAANPLLKEVRHAVARGTLTAGGCCVAETFHLLEEALQSPCEVKTVLAAESARAAVVAFGPRLAGVKVALLPDALFAGIATTETTQGVIALVQPRQWQFAQLLHGKALVVVLDGIQDPGNAGAIVRTAEAFGASGVLFVKGTVSPHNPKTLRASAGSLFRVPFDPPCTAWPLRPLSPRSGRTGSNCLPPCRPSPPPPRTRSPPRTLAAGAAQFDRKSKRL